MAKVKPDHGAVYIRCIRGAFFKGVEFGRGETIHFHRGWKPNGEEYFFRYTGEPRIETTLEELEQLIGFSWEVVNRLDHYAA